MITCNLTKPEATLDQVRKQYKDLKPTDAALVAIALVESGRFAYAVYDGENFSYPDDQNKLATRYVTEISQAIQQQAEEAPKKTTKKTVSEDEVALRLTLAPNLNAAEKVLGNRDDLKTLVSDIIQEGVEYHYAATDLTWQWTLERINWTTISGEDLPRSVKFEPEFGDNSVAVEVGAKKTRRKK